MNAIPEELQKSFSEARANLLRARFAYIKMIEIEKKNEEAMIAGEADDLKAYDDQEKTFTKALALVITFTFQIYTYYLKPRDPEAGINALLTLLTKAF